MYHQQPEELEEGFIETVFKTRTQGRFIDELQWSLISRDQKQEALANVCFDMDFIGISGVAAGILDDGAVSQLLASPQGRTLSACYMDTARCSEFKRVLVYAHIGDYLFGEPADQDDEREEEPETCRPKSQRNQALRDYINSKLPGTNRGEEPFSDIKAFITDTFGSRNAVLFRFGQKQELNANLVELLDSIAKNHTVDIAIASQFGNPAEMWCASSRRQQLGDCYSYLFSVEAVNILQRSGTKHIPESYRTICYNTCQHTKKKHQPRLTMSNSGDTFVDLVSAAVSKTVGFVEDDVIKKLHESSQLRVEVYFPYEAETMRYRIQQMLEFIKSGFEIVAVPKRDAMEFITFLCRSVNFALDLFSGKTFSEIYIILELYHQFCMGVFCTTKLSKSFLTDYRGFGLCRENYSLPYAKLCNRALLSFSSIAFSKRIGAILNSDDSMIAYLMVAHITEIALLAVKEAAMSSHITAAADALCIWAVEHFVKEECQRLEKEVDLPGFMGYAASYSRSKIVSLVCRALVEIHRSDSQIFALLCSRFNKKTLRLRAGENVFVFKGDECSLTMEKLRILVKTVPFDQALAEYKDYLCAANQSQVGQILKELSENSIKRATKILLKDSVNIAAVEWLDCEGFLRCLYAYSLFVSDELVDIGSLRIVEIIDNLEDLKTFIAVAEGLYATLPAKMPEDMMKIPLALGHSRDNFSNRLKKQDITVTCGQLLYSTGLFGIRQSKAKKKESEYKRINIQYKLYINDRAPLGPDVIDLECYYFQSRAKRTKNIERKSETSWTHILEKTLGQSHGPPRSSRS